MVYWYEVNERWQEASLVWCESFRRVLMRGSDVPRELWVWCDVAGNADWVNGYMRRVMGLLGSVIDVRFETFDSSELELSEEVLVGLEATQRCIDVSSIRIAVSRIEHYNVIRREKYPLPSAFGGEKGLNQFDAPIVHCDIDGIFRDGYSIDEYEYAVWSEIAGVEEKRDIIVGVNEFDDIRTALATTHDSDFMDSLHGVYLNAGMLAFYRVSEIDLDELGKYLLNAYCLEQDYLNTHISHRCEIGGEFNFTYRKHERELRLAYQDSVSNKHQSQSPQPLSPHYIKTDTCNHFLPNRDIPVGYTVPFFVHFYGEDKPFLKCELSNTEILLEAEGKSSVVIEGLPLYYYGEYYAYVHSIRMILSRDFLDICRERFNEYLRTWG